MSLQVAVQGDEIQEVDHREGMTVKTALKKANFKPDKQTTITRNGEQINLKESVQDGDILVATPKISNG